MNSSKFMPCPYSDRTGGEGMTNGEKLIETFPSIGLYKKAHDGIQINFNSVWFNAEYKEPTTKNDLAQERYQDLIEYFGDNETAKTILEDKKEFKAWLERVKWHVKRADELARELEQLKPMVEIDLDSVIKQKYIEREVLDKIREQIKSHLRGVEITLEVLVENDPLRPKMEGAKDTLEECLEIIDKYKEESEET